MVAKDRLLRSSKELHLLINQIKLEALKHDRKVPTTAQITKCIAKRIEKDKEVFIYEEFIKL